MVKNKKQLRDKFLNLLKEQFAEGGASEKELQTLSIKFDSVLVAFKDSIANQIITKVPPEVIISNLKEQLSETLQIQGDRQESLLKGIGELYSGLADSIKIQESLLKEYKQEGVKVREMPAVQIKGPVTVVKDDSTVVAALTALFASLMQGLVKLANRTVKVMPTFEAFTTPQYVVLVDPATGAPVRPDEIGKTPPGGGGMQGTAIAASGGPTHVGARGADEFNDGTTAVTTAGTAVVLAGDTECFQVTIQAHPDNVGDIVVGGPSVIAASGTRRGLALFGSQWATFKVSNLNQIYLDATEDGDKVNYFYER